MLSKNKVLTWLQGQSLASIASLSPEGQPQLAVVYTYVDKKFNCYFVTKVVTRKSINLSKNKAISILWCDEKALTICEMSGEAHVVDEGEEVAVAMTHLQDKMIDQTAEYWIPPVSQLKGSQYIIFQIVPDCVSWVDYSAATIEKPEPKRLDFKP